MTKPYPYLLQGDNIVVVIDSKPYTINKTHIVYEQVKEAIKTGKWAELKDLVEPKTIVLKYAQGHVSINGEQFLWKGRPMHTALSNKMIQMLKEGFSIDPLVAFIHNLMKNPSKRAIDELYGFLEKGQLPITPDGYFLAYKKVCDDYLDCHSGTVLNKPADLLTDSDAAFIGRPVGRNNEVMVELVDGVSTVSMDRSEVDDDKDRTCSSGLHFCSLDYLNHFGGSRIVILKINPADVVSIPSDYQHTKGRTAKYQVVGEIAPETASQKLTESVNTEYNAAPKAPAKTTRPAKTGDTAFYAGYSDAYNLADFDTAGWTDPGDIKNYGEGYVKGSRDEAAGNDPRYVFVGTKPTKQANKVQEYDRFGRKLSMTKDAIRKREARARAKAQKLTGSVNTAKPVSRRDLPTGQPVTWPFPAKNRTL